MARVSVINGEVTTQRGDSGDWIAAAVNAPLVSGDKIYAARASRAEVQLDYANFLRIGENTEVRLADIEERHYQLQVSRGILTYRVLRDQTADVEINTPLVAVRPLRRGVYRVLVFENGQTEITVREGRAEIASRQGTETLRSGRTLIVRGGPGDEIEVQEVAAAGRDDWDQWNEHRDDYLARVQSYRYVHSSVYGAEDLDYYGSWTSVPGYGPVWYPRVAAGWAPYSFGRWVWIDWYGWSWVDYAPWGWAPFHYGRWFYRGGFGWGWCPGPVIYNPWAPALVGFFGWGGHSGFAFGFGFSNIGWVPLAPGERFFPWYGSGFYGRGGRTFVDNSVHITNITNITNVYRNARVNGGINAVNTQEFGRRLINAQHVNAGEIRNAGQIRGLLPVVPDRQSLRVSDREVRPGTTPQVAGNQNRFFTRRQPAQNVERVPFAEQQQQVERSIRAGAGLGGRRGEAVAGQTAAPAERRERRSIRSLAGSGPAQAGAPANTPSVAPAAPQTESGRAIERTSGWRRLGQERRDTPAAATASPAAPERNAAPSGSGFRRLGEERRAAPEAAPAPAVNNQRNMERDSGWRRLGQERRDTPAAASPAAPERNAAPSGSGFRRLGEERNMERDSGGRREMRSEPRQMTQPRSENPAASPWFGRRAAPEMQQRSEPSGGDRSIRGMGRSDRQLEIHRPVTIERAPRNEGGGHAAPAPRSQGGGDRGDGGRQSESRGGSHGRR